MANVGSILKHRRESLGLSLLEIQDKIRINSKFIEAIEKGDFEALPNQIYIKIFLRAYVKFLGLDVPEIIALYEEQSTPKSSVKFSPLVIPAKFVPAESAPAVVSRGSKQGAGIQRNGIFLRVLILIGLILILVVVSWKTFYTPHSSITGIEQKIFDTLPPDKGGLRGVGDKLLLSAETLDTTWLQLIVDENAPIEILLNKGDKKDWSANEKFTLWIGNPAGATFFLNKKRIFIPEEKKSKVIRELVLSKELLSGKEEVINPYGK